MYIYNRFSAILAAFVLLAGVAVAQETQVKVVDEVVAQVNDGVITLSRVKREVKNAVDSFVQEGKSREEAQKIVDEKQGELIANLINEELLIQKAKESGIDIEASLNARFLEIMKQYGLTTVDQLYEQMERSGVDPKQLRDDWRKQATRERVIEREVQAKVYWSANGKELRDYYEKNKAKFTTPETVVFSEIFLGFAGRDEKSVRDKAQQIYSQLKAGGDFDKLGAENSDKGVIAGETRKSEKIKIKDMVDVVSKPLAGLKVGEYTAPFDVEQLGVAILRVDERNKASEESVFDENAVRMAILNEKFPGEQKKFMAKLREDSYIKINDNYRPLVAPILFADERKEKPSK